MEMTEQSSQLVHLELAVVVGVKLLEPGVDFGVLLLSNLLQLAIPVRVPLPSGHLATDVEAHATAGGGRAGSAPAVGLRFAEVRSLHACLAANALRRCMLHRKKKQKSTAGAMPGTARGPDKTSLRMPWVPP
eukprot:7382153-Prymnesium_polylepis.1